MKSAMILLAIVGLAAAKDQFRDEYDYKNVLVYSGSPTGSVALFYFPFSTHKRIGFKLK